MRETCDQPDPERETSGRQMKDIWETSEGKVREIMRPTGPRVGDKWETNEDKWETSEGNHATNQTQSGRQVGDT